MAIFMTIAACYAVLQLATLGWFTGRSLRLGTLLLAIPVGAYGSGVAALIVQYLYTHAVAAISGGPLSEVVRTASYTVDPFLEELCKIAPLFVLGLQRRTRLSWGMTDYLLLGAGLGAGFGLLEELLQVADLADRAIAGPDGWLLPTSVFSPIFIPDLGTTLGSWLPEPASTVSLGDITRPETFLHVAWSTVAGLGAGAILRARGGTRWLGVLAIAFVAAEHCAYNYGHSPAGAGGAFAHVAGKLLWLYPLIGLAIAGLLDRRDAARGRAALTDVQPKVSLGAFARLRLPWTTLAALRFVRLRRSLWYLRAGAAAELVEPLHAAVRKVRAQIDRAGTAAAWHRAPTFGRLLARVVRPRVLRRLVLRWQVLVWLVLAVPPLAFLVIGGFQPTASLQRALTTSAAMRWPMLAFLIGGLAWLAWQLIGVARSLPGTRRNPSADGVARAELRLIGGAGALLAGAFSLWRLLAGHDLDDSIVARLHILEALAAVLIIVGVALLLAGLFVLFPPGGGLALAFAAEAGEAAGAAALAMSPQLLLEGGVVSGLTGALLAEAAGGSGDEPSQSIAPRDVHGALRGAERDMTADEIWNDPDSVMYTDNERGYIIKTLDNGDGTARLVVRDMSNPSREPITMIQRYSQQAIERRLASGEWE